MIGQTDKQRYDNFIYIAAGLNMRTNTTGFRAFEKNVKITLKCLIFKNYIFTLPKVKRK